MIGKAKSCVGGSSLFYYVLNTDKGYELLRQNLACEGAKNIYEEMKILQSLNYGGKNKLFSMVLSPHLEEGQNLNKEELRDITISFLKELNIDYKSQQFIAFVHTEKQHKHIHILMNRVQLDGKLFPDNFIGKKAQWAAHRTANSFSLISAKQMQIDKVKRINEDKATRKIIRKEIFENHKRVVANNPNCLEDYISKMHKYGYGFIPAINKKGQLQGFRIKDYNTQKEFKASEVHKELGLKSLLELGLPFISEIELHPNLIQSHIIALDLLRRRKERERNNNERLQKEKVSDNFQKLKIEEEKSEENNAERKRNENSDTLDILKPKTKFKL